MFVQLTFDMQTVPFQPTNRCSCESVEVFETEYVSTQRVSNPPSDSCRMLQTFGLSGQTFALVFKHWLINLCIKQKQTRPLRNSYPSAIRCRPWATNPRDHHMHIMVTWERPQANSDRKLHHWKQICWVKLKLKCCPWLGIFWICCLTLIHQSPTCRWLIIAGRLQCMCDFCLILICLYIP